MLRGRVHARIKLLRVQERVGIRQQLVARRAFALLAVKTAAHGADDGGRHAAAVLGGFREIDLVRPVDDGLAARHLVGDLAKGREAVDHLVQDAAERPDVRGLAELHELGSAGVTAVVQGRRDAELAVLRGRKRVLVRVHQRFGRHVVGRADLRLAVHIDRHFGLDGVGNAEVDELEAALDKDKVGRFEIAVHDVTRVHGLHAFEHLFPVVPNEGRVKTSTFGGALAAFEKGVEVEFAYFHEL